MTHRDKEGPHVRPRTQNGADYPAAVAQRRPGPAALWRLVKLANETALRNSDCRKARDETQMAGQSAAPRMCDTLPVTQQKVGPNLQPRKSCKQSGDFAEREESGNVWKPCSLARDGIVNQFEAGQGEHCHRGTGYQTAVLKSNIGASDKTHRSNSIPLYDA